MAIFKWKLLTTIYEVFATFNTNTRLLIPSNALSLSLNIVVYLRERETGKKTFLSSLVPNMWLDGSVGSGAQQVTGRHGFESRWSRCFFSFRLISYNCLLINEDHGFIWQIQIKSPSWKISLLNFYRENTDVQITLSLFVLIQAAACTFTNINQF